jgi:hypothetical protein
METAGGMDSPPDLVGSDTGPSGDVTPSVEPTDGRDSSGGTGGTGGPGGAGGIGGNGAADGAADVSDTRAPSALGQACGGNHECASGHCADGVCCDQACTGACAQCSAAGRCEMPADDPACEAVACPVDTACRDFATSITASRCKAVGTCKGASDCGYVNVAARTPCGFYQQMTHLPQFCDGTGVCTGPTVRCGADTACGVSPGVCCATGSATSCGGTGCPMGSYTITCDEAADCRPGTFCCLQATAGMGTAYCAASCVTSPAIKVVCNPNMSGECPTGTCQPSGLPGPPYFLCQ